MAKTKKQAKKAHSNLYCKLTAAFNTSNPSITATANFNVAFFTSDSNFTMSSDVIISCAALN